MSDGLNEVLTFNFTVTAGVFHLIPPGTDEYEVPFRTGHVVGDVTNFSQKHQVD